MPSTGAPDLRGAWVVVTRPAHQADELVRAIESARGHVIRFPVIEIGGPRDPEALRRRLQHLSDYDWLVFVSANAARRGITAIRDQGAAVGGARIAAVGAATATVLQELGMRVDLVPAGVFNSESLLAEDAFADVADRRFLVFRGDGGREALRDALRARGARVDYAECYCRVMPRTSPDRLLRAWSEQRLDVFTVTSSEGLRNLLAMLGPQHRDRALATALVVIGQRQREAALASGWTAAVYAAANAAPDAIVAALDAWRRAID